MLNTIRSWFADPKVLAELEACRQEFELRRDRREESRKHDDAMLRIDRRAEDQALQREFNAAVAAIQEKHQND
jgi:hypothetical protein